jgi:hypothetical protein
VGEVLVLALLLLLLCGFSGVSGVDSGPLMYGLNWGVDLQSPIASSSESGFVVSTGGYLLVVLSTTAYVHGDHLVY